ncbi:MAG: response regulator transcription factor [Ignavibacteriales bacterium]|nr:MAG: response regulator transcription factor [Ignavibacteriales bacterium]
MRKILIVHGLPDQETSYKETLKAEGFNTYLTAGEKNGISIAVTYLPDIIICDICNPESELKVVKELSHNNATLSIPLIVLTDIKQLIHSRTLMELGADDVIVKPVAGEPVLKSIQSRLKKLEALKEKLIYKLTYIESENKTAQKKNDHLLIKIGNDLKFIEYSSIVYIIALKEYTKLVLEDGCKLIVRKSIRNWIDTLPPKDFLRIHRATIVNIWHLQKIEKCGLRSYCVYMKNISKPFQLSQRYGNIMRKTFKG